MGVVAGCSGLFPYGWLAMIRLAMIRLSRCVAGWLFGAADGLAMVGTALFRASNRLAERRWVKK